MINYKNKTKQLEALQPHVTFKATIKPINEVGKLFIKNDIEYEETMYYSDKADEQLYEAAAMEGVMARGRYLINNFESLRRRLMGVGKFYFTQPFPYGTSPQDFQHFETVVRQGVHYEIQVERIEHKIEPELTFNDIKAL